MWLPFYVILGILMCLGNLCGSRGGFFWVPFGDFMGLGPLGAVTLPAPWGLRSTARLTVREPQVSQVEIVRYAASAWCTTPGNFQHLDTKPPNGPIFSKGVHFSTILGYLYWPVDMICLNAHCCLRFRPNLVGPRRPAGTLRGNLKPPFVLVVSVGWWSKSP